MERKINAGLPAAILAASLGTSLPAQKADAIAIVDTHVFSDRVVYVAQNDLSITQDALGMFFGGTQVDGTYEITVNNGDNTPGSDESFLGNTYNTWNGPNIASLDGWHIIMDYSDAINDSNSILYNVDIRNIPLVTVQDGIMSTSLDGSLGDSAEIQYANVNSVSEPGTLGLLAVGAGLLYASRRKKAATPDIVDQ